MAKKWKRTERRRAIYIFPNLFTTMSLFFGFYAIMCAIQGRFYYSACLILVATIMDGLDGTVARMTKTTSLFGVEYDSLSDLLSFCAAPSILIYLWALKPHNLHFSFLPVPDDRSLGLGLIAAFIYLVCGALRLARFNVSVGHRDPGFFQGLPTTAAAGIVSAAVLWHYRFPGPPISPNGPLTLGFIVLLAVLMVSNLDFLSLKNKIFTKNNHPFETLVLIIIVLACLIIKAKTLLLPLAFFYLSLAPIITIVRRLRRDRDPGANLSKANTGEQDAEPGSPEAKAAETRSGDTRLPGAKPSETRLAEIRLADPQAQAPSAPEPTAGETMAAKTAGREPRRGE
ncbi:MAG: CDP-diacylglycerol--serine O-phosphatidyltransferase [Deltaproteobacteria bacterium]|jgi:CDP-diacylglycerol--serine O-phosphatidyltransferase|nr:CDP-diacylglycerol--serine O-phosphatidyltransferase [Deltaproteobacteria bacterium]